MTVLVGGDKVAVIRSYLEGWQLRTMVETGIYEGGGSGGGCIDILDRLDMIDIQEANCEKARANYPTAHVWLGDSAAVLDAMLGEERQGWYLDTPALFWLDAHYVVDYDSEDVLDKYPVPLVRELEAIRAWPHAASSVVLIDDVRLFGAYGWPSTQAVRGMAEEVWVVEERDDILRCTPRV